MTAMAGQLAGPRWLMSPSTSPVLHAMAPLLFSSYNIFVCFFRAAGLQAVFNARLRLGLLLLMVWHCSASLLFDSSPIYFSLIFCRIVQFGFDTLFDIQIVSFAAT
jgi:hypothetical protein